MRKIIVAVLLVILLAAGFFLYIFLGPGTGFQGDVKYLYIPSQGATRESVMRQLDEDSLVRHPSSFKWLAGQRGYWEKIRPGRYKIAKGDNVLSIIKRLRNGQQDAVNLVIVKFRTREAMAGAISKKLEFDSTTFIAFMNNIDSIKEYGVDTNTLMTIITPNTYSHYWNTTPRKVFNKFYDAYKQVWNDERKQKAAAHNLSPASACTLASIIEEETNDKNDKPLMASVYINRLNKGMRLGADPTVKFALRNFELRRIYETHLAVESPYNTYRNFGLPPGPICTPSMETLDAVLNAPATNYLYFVAKSDFSGAHVFTESYDEHLKYAKEYQLALNKEMEKKRAKEETE